MTALSALARMLGIRSELAEDAMRSERAARAVLSRRSLFAAAGAMAAGAAFSFGGPVADMRWVWVSSTALYTTAPGFLPAMSVTVKATEDVTMPEEIVCKRAGTKSGIRLIWQMTTSVYEPSAGAALKEIP
jgi:hypothetical protein